jgi:hypothetical protein
MNGVRRTERLNEPRSAVTSTRATPHLARDASSASTVDRSRDSRARALASPSASPFAETPLARVPRRSPKRSARRATWPLLFGSVERSRATDRSIDRSDRSRRPRE